MDSIDQHDPFIHCLGYSDGQARWENKIGFEYFPERDLQSLEEAIEWTQHGDSTIQHSDVMRYNVYALLEQRNLKSGKSTFDLYKVCLTCADALYVYKEKVGEPKTIREEVTAEGPIWWLDEDSTGSACIVRHTLDGPLEEAQ